MAGAGTTGAAIAAEFRAMLTGGNIGAGGDDDGWAGSISTEHPEGAIRGQLAPSAD